MLEFWYCNQCSTTDPSMWQQPFQTTSFQWEWNGHGELTSSLTHNPPTLGGTGKQQQCSRSGFWHCNQCSTTNPSTWKYPLWTTSIWLGWHRCGDLRPLHSPTTITALSNGNKMQHDWDSGTVINVAQPIPPCGSPLQTTSIWSNHRSISGSNLQYSLWWEWSGHMKSTSLLTHNPLTLGSIGNSNNAIC